MVRWHAFAHNGVHTLVFTGYGVMWSFVLLHSAWLCCFGVLRVCFCYGLVFFSGSILFGLPILYIVGASFSWITGQGGENGALRRCSSSSSSTRDA